MPFAYISSKQVSMMVEDTKRNYDEEDGDKVWITYFLY